MTARSAIARCVLGAAALATIGCATATPFHRHLAAREWREAARVFSADSSLREDVDALYAAGVLFGSPDLATYDPERAADLLQHLLARYPETKYRSAAVERLTLLNEIRELRLELERLKAIDLAPRARRPAPSREHL